MRDPANTLWVSAASAWEIATKHRIGKLPAGATIIREWHQRIEEDRFRELAITSSHSLRAGALPSGHRDPFDRMLAAQSLIEQMDLISMDARLSDLGVNRIWL